jgi:adenosylcobinamide amidohydrolase
MGKMCLEQIGLAEGVKLVVHENVLAVFCDSALKTVSSAYFNGGNKQVKSLLNVGVPEGYSDLSLHLDPLKLITSSAAKVGVAKDYLAMVTAAKIQNYSLKSYRTEGFSISVAVTAGCQHGESSGEEMDVQEIAGTINIIVFIDGNPTDSCMVASLITATEAKSAALRDLDVRSRYTGDSATGSVTDSVVVAATGKGKTILLGGPASKLGKLVGSCTRQAVSEALLKQEPFWACRSVLDRLKERLLSLEKLTSEVSKIEDLTITAESLAEVLKSNPIAGAYLLAAAKMDDDYKKNLVPTDFPSWQEAGKCFGEYSVSESDYIKPQDYPEVDLPFFVKHALIKIVKIAQNKS